MTKGKGIPPEATIKPALPVAPKTITQQEFIMEYSELCKRTGWMWDLQPVLKPMKDLGGSLITVQVMVIPFRENVK